jgi:hypothetical protein
MHGLARQSFFNKSMFRVCFFESHGTKACKFGEDRSILLRHKFGNQWFVLGCRKDRQLLDKLAELTVEMKIPRNVHDDWD